MSSERIESKARLFNVVANVVDVLDSAWENNQAWLSSSAITRGPDGEPDGGCEIHIRIYPPGIASPSSESALQESLAKRAAKEAQSVAGASS
jgi:hypothetical protein